MAKAKKRPAKKAKSAKKAPKSAKKSAKAKPAKKSTAKTAKPKAAKPKAAKAAKPKAAKAARATVEPTASKTLDWVVSDGLATGTREERAVIAMAMENHPMYAVTYAAVIKAYKQSYPADPPESEETILGTDPNDFDVDPSPFYEGLVESFGVPTDPENQYFGGYGGPIRDLIAFLTARWDGKLRA